MALPILTLPAGFTYPVKRSNLWKTLHQEAISGQDNPIQLWSYPRWQWEIPFEGLRNVAATELQTLQGFYNTVGGSAGVWQWNDVDDTTVPTDQNFGTGDGVTIKFPLVRTYGAFSEFVFAPTITNIKINGSITAAYTLGTAGMITFNSAPANAATLTWNGTFNWLVRFDADNLDFTKFMSNVWECKKVSFTSIKMAPA